MNSPTVIEKEMFRRRCRRYREEVTAMQYQKKSAAVLEQVRRLPEMQRAQIVHTYWPIAGNKEVDTRPLIQSLLEEKKRVVLPVIDFSAGANGILEHREFREETELHTNRWGITEPRDGQRVPVGALDIVLVPALGADRRGHRIGYGGGYYDRFLAEVAVPTVGLVYADCLIDDLAAEPHDVPLSIVVTENEVLRVSS